MPCPSYPNLVAWTCLQTGRVTPKVEGPPGCGKSRSIEAFAKALGRNCYPLIGSIRAPEDIGGYPKAIEDMFMAVLPPQWAWNAQHGKWIIFHDELTTCSPPLQAAMLGVIAERRVGDFTLPEGVWQIAACNPPDCAANGSELEPPMANRLVHLTWETDYAGWEKAMQNGGQFSPPNFVALPDDWEKCLHKTTGLLAAFHKHLPGRLEKYPTERSKVSGPWPSMRSWTNAGVCMAALSAIDAEPLLRYRALAGCVGEDVALEYQEWESKLDLPDPETWIAHAIKVRQGHATWDLDIPPRCDQVMAVLSSLVDRVKNHDLDPKTGKPTEARWLAGVDCFAEVAKNHMELAIDGAAGLFTAMPHTKDAQELCALVAKTPRDFCNSVLAIHRNIEAALKA